MQGLGRVGKHRPPLQNAPQLSAKGLVYYEFYKLSLLSFLRLVVNLWSGVDQLTWWWLWVLCVLFAILFLEV